MNTPSTSGTSGMTPQERLEVTLPNGEVLTLTEADHIQQYAKYLQKAEDNNQLRLQIQQTNANANLEAQEALRQKAEEDASEALRLQVEAEQRLQADQDRIAREKRERWDRRLKAVKDTWKAGVAAKNRFFDDFLPQFSLKLTGVNQELLKKAPEENQTRFSRQGFAMLVTIIFAYVAGTYFVASLLGLHWILSALFVGPLWAWAVARIDMLAVMGIKPINPAKLPKLPDNPGVLDRFSRSWEILKMRLSARVLLRIVGAVIVALFISLPLELAIFHSTTEKKIMSNEAEELSSARKRYRTDLEDINQREAALTKAITDAAAEEEAYLDGLKAPILVLDQELSAVEDSFDVEVNVGRGGRTGDYGQAAAALDTIMIRKMRRRNALQAAYEAAVASNPHKTVREAAEAEKNRMAPILVAEREDRTAEYEEEIALIKESRSTDFLAHYSALEELKKSHSGVRWVSTLVFLLFLYIELNPVIAKLSMPYLRYHEMEENLLNEHLSAYFAEEKAQIELATEQELERIKLETDRLKRIAQQNLDREKSLAQVNTGGREDRLVWNKNQEQRIVDAYMRLTQSYRDHINSLALTPNTKKQMIDSMDTHLWSLI